MFRRHQVVPWMIYLVAFFGFDPMSASADVFDESRSFCPNTTELTVTCMIRFGLNCENRCGESYEVGHSRCACDSLCMLYGDCCMDFLDVCPHLHKDTEEPGLINAGKCQRTFYPSNTNIYTFIADCPPRWDEDLTRTLCVNTTLTLASHIPVIDWSTNISYANVFCATCNLVSSFQPWDVRVVCSEEDPVNDTAENLIQHILSGTCQLVSKWPNADNENTTFRPRICKEITRDTCNEQCDNVEIVNGCKSPFLAPVAKKLPRQMPVFYKNKQCALCEMGREALSIRFLCVAPPQLPGLGAYSFALLTDFDHDGCILVSDVERGRSLVRSCDGLRKRSLQVSHECNDTFAVGFCANQTALFKSIAFIDPEYSDWLGILSLTCIAASVICLTARLVLQSVVSRFHNLSGKSQFCLCLTMLLALVAFLLGPFFTDNGKACTALGLLMHWGFLSSFLWMNVIAFDTWLVFRPASTFIQRTVETQRALLIRYSLLAWCSAALVVAGAYSLDLAKVDSEFRPYYGTAVCWIAQRYALVVFFFIPLGVAILINSFLFVLTARNLHSALKASSSTASTAKDEHHFGVYVRLFILMGVTWVTAYVATFVDHDILWGIYTILNASQGVFISLSTLLTRRILQGFCRTPTSGKTLSTSETANPNKSVSDSK